MQKYKYEGEITAAGLISFYEDFEEGNLKSFLKSEDPPVGHEGPVTVTQLSFNLSTSLEPPGKTSCRTRPRTYS